MKKSIAILISILSLSILSGCNQALTRSFGGKATVHIPGDEQMLSITWKESSLWILTYKPSTKECLFRENSAAGVLEGVVQIPDCTPLQVTPQVPTK